ncbi:MAG: cupin domain-containing protein [Rhodocyclaceae bacterium]|nr:cupin domain-containing protein [Rhodocyclaceae bacterium]
MTMLPLGGMGAADFMAVHWQKRPLFVPGAVPEAARVVDVETLFDLARHPDAQTRRIARKADVWTVDQGPLRPRQLAAKGVWTVLVQGLNHFLLEADALLRRFAFIPYTRLDDVMASYATRGGGVGPHFDSYDVFLIQAQGTRRWRISGQTDRDLLPDQPLKLMADFRAEQTFDCRPGDLLYLPPGYAHDGVALDDCITLSVGFRAPARSELAREFLLWLADRIDLPGLYADPDLRATDTPAAIDAGLLARVGGLLSGIRWDDAQVSAFLCQYLSEPKPHVVFDPPEEPLGEAGFARAAARHGVALDLQTLMLYDHAQVSCNGEALTPPDGLAAAMHRLADQRFLEGGDVSRALADCLYPIYRVGHLHVAAAPR